MVVDTVGSPTWEFSMGALVPGGRLVTCGGTGGGRVEVSLPRLFFGQYEIMGSTMGTFREFDELTRLVDAGLPIHVDSVYPLADYPFALARMEAAPSSARSSFATSRDNRTSALPAQSLPARCPWRRV